MKLAVFDFDKTITTQDSFMAFILYVHGKSKLLRGLFILLPTLISYFIKLVPNDQAKQKVFNYFWGGWPKEKLESVAKDFSSQALAHLVKKSAVEKIEWHKKQGHKVVVVSASLNCYLEPWCQTHHLDLICTEVEYLNGLVTGRFLTKNCYAQEKVQRLKAKYHLSDFEYIYVYGDGRGDKEMLEMADESHPRP
ncbi:MAG: HAD-IB family hydrolase [Candidatus Omnitrophota bacterium]|nr:HAD-IB family hydrolase [Candidatus Omnitrophota bacterium]